MSSTNRKMDEFGRDEFAQWSSLPSTLPYIAGDSLHAAYTHKSNTTTEKTPLVRRRCFYISGNNTRKELDVLEQLSAKNPQSI